MTSIRLPTSPGIQSGKPRLLDFGGVLTPPGGGAAQRVNRLGNRFALDVTLPPMQGWDDGRMFVSRLAQAMTAGALFGFFQDYDPGETGSFVVDGAGQLGSSLTVRGGTAGYQFVEGQFFSIVHGGRRYLHGVAADTGGLTLSIFPMLRISPTDGDICEFHYPKIEGFLSGNAVEWAYDPDPFVNLTFTITEAA